MTDHNSAEAWDTIWRNEDGAYSWRIYPNTFRLVAKMIPSPSRILDIGCGVGILASRLKRAGHNITGIDISPYAIAEMRLVFDIPGIVGRVPPLPFPSDSYDICIATEMLEHLLPEEGELLISEMHRVSPKSIICVPDGVLPPESCKEHNTTFTEHSFKRLLSRYYSHIQIGKFNDIFDITSYSSSISVIALPTLIAICNRDIPEDAVVVP